MKRSTYRLLVQSEDKRRNALETVIYGLVALSALLAIWQFATQPEPPPTGQINTARPAQVEVQFAS